MDDLRKLLAGAPGFEPGLTSSEPVVLPLDDAPSSQEISELIL